MNGVTRLGLMGCGTVADYGHAPAILATPGLRLEAVFDPVGAQAERFAKKWGAARAFTDQEAFLDSPLDAVVVTSPAGMHQTNVTAALARGLPVLCEKPLAQNLEDARAIASMSRQSPVPLFVGFDYRFSPVSRTIRECIDRGDVGEVRLVRFVYLWDLHGRTRPDGTVNQRRVDRMIEGGPLVDCGVHQIDLARWWLNSDIHRAEGRGVWFEEFEAPEHLQSRFVHKNGVVTTVEVSFAYGVGGSEPAPVFTYEIIGTEGVLKFDREARTLTLRNGRGTEPLPFAGEKNFAGMYQQFVVALQGGGTGDLATADDGLQAMEAAWEATLSAIRTKTER
jgi:predicted dehydrogenase